ncbi:MAG: hypothetical protein V3V00_05735, partial [Saprospiraceae bacterium]
FVQCCFVLFFDSKIAVESRNGLGFYLFIRTPLLSKINTGRKKDGADIEELQKILWSKKMNS